MSRIFTLISLNILILSCSTRSGQPQVFQDSSGAIRGYDPVAYFRKGEPVKGRSDLLYEWQGASWHFSSPENMEEFRTNPDKYTPQYGGYCAYGTADGHKASTEPEAFTILDGKLFLNYNKDVQILWTNDRPGYIRKADSNWLWLKDK